MDEEERRQLISEYRFVYWRGDRRNRFLRVCRGQDDLAENWGVFDGEPHHGGAAWSGTYFSYELRGADAFCWEEDEALTIASLLARQWNADIIKVMEAKFPGEFKGGPHDYAAKEGRKPTE